MISKTKIVSLLASSLIVCGVPLAAYAENPIEGVWQFEQSHLRAINRETKEWFERTTQATNPRIYIFTDRHYSYMAISGDKARPLRKNAGEGRMGGPKVPADQRMAEYRPLDVETGTLTIEADKITLRPLIDHIPDYMLGDGTGDRTVWFVIDGDALTLIRRTDEGATITDSYARLE